MVSTLHITLVNNQPSSQWLGRSASCEETNLLGFSSTLTPTSKTTSLSTSSVLRPQAPGTGVTGLSTTHGLVTPTPYSPSAGPRASSWSPVRLKTKPLPDFLKKLNPESAPVASPGTKTSWCRAAASQGPGRPGVATSTGDVKVGQVSPTLAARWPHAAKSDSSKPEVSPRADRKVLGIPVSSAAVSSVTVSQVAPPGRPPTPQGERRRLSGGSPSMTRKEVSPAPTNDPSVKSAAEPSRVLHEASSVADQNTTKSDQLDEPQGSSRRSSLDSAKKESPTVARKLMSDTAWLTSSNRSATLPALKTSSAPWQQRPNRLSSASLQRFEDSVHSGGGREGVGGGVMEDGGPHTRVAPASSTHRKANSLPGYYSRGSTLHQPSFREAFNTSKSPTPPARNDSAPAAPPRGPTSPRTPRVVAVPSVPPQQQRQQQHHQQQQNSRQHQNHHKQKQQQSTNQLQEYQKQHQQQLQQQLRQKQLQQQQQQQLLWQQHQQQQRLQESHRQNAQQQIKSQRQPKLPHQGTAPPISQGRQPPRQEPPPPKPVPSSPEKKNKKSILSGIFRRRKKGSSSTSSSSSDSSSSDNEEPPQRRSFLRRRSKKKEKKDPILPAPSIPPAEERLSRSYCDFPDGSDLRSYRRVRVVPVGTGSLGKETQPLGIPTLTAQPGQLNRLGVSASHDSLPLSLGSWTGGGSHASLGYYSGGGMGTRSSSTDTISKKERREALKARVERLRERIRDTSSDEEKASVSSHSMYGSESSLSKTGSLSRRSRAARTERFLRRKSYELETLRNETEKDRRNREAVQARIEEIQRVREFEAKRNKLNEERKSQSVPKTKPRWSAKLVYQESSEYESSVLLRTPSVSPSASPHMKAKFDGHAKDGVVLRNKPRHVTPSVAVSLPVPSVTSSRRSFQDFDTPTQNTLRGHRSASYDSNINRNSFVTQPPNVPITSSGPTTNRSGLTPPAPPPRDRSRILSPCDGRPMSFSFESLNQEAHRPTSSQSSMSNFTKGSSPSPSVRSVPAYLGPRSNPQPPGPQPMLIPTRRSYSELELSQQQQMEAKNSYPIPPSRPAPPGYPNSHYSYTDQPPRPQNHYYRPQQQQQPNQQVQYYTDQSPQHNKTVPISSVPASPSSDYSSYMSDNSIKLQQANTAWRQKEQEIKNKISVLPSTTPAVISDSSPSNSPKLENGVACSPGRQQQQGEGIYGKIEAKKIRPEPITLKQAESFSSLSGQSDVSSPVPRGPDSDSSQGSLARDKKKQAQNRPLSMVLEKAESGEKETPPGTPKARPQPPLRSNWQPATPESEAMKRNKFKEMIKHKLDSKTEKNITPKEFEDMFQKEKEKLENSKSSNFEEALKELEEIYASLRLDSEDLLDGAERRDLPVHHQTLKDNLLNDKKDLLSDGDSSFHDSERTQSLSGRRSGVPDAKGDDMHFRRCQQSTRNQPDVQKALQMTGSYLLVSPAHVTPSDLDKDMPKDPMMVGEPDVVYDDVSYRNIKKANSIKIIDPQPPFGIPLGPTTQASQNDYLHVTPKENYRPKMTARKQPDTAMDDLAFRNLRKDKGTKEVNTSELDELLCEARAGSPRRRTVRSSSADRAQSLRGDPDRGLKHYTPRQVKHQQETRRVGSQKDNMTDTEVTGHSVSSRHNPSWLERAHLLDPKWDMSTNNLSTSTETLTELSSARAVSQPDIRRAIIREARAPPGGPEELLGGQLHHITASSLATPTAVTLATITVPRLVKVHTVHSAPASPVILDSKTYKPLDSIFNSKPKPFYLTNKETEQKDSTHEQGQQQQQEKKQKKQQQHQEQQQKPQQQDEVDIAKLDALISTLSKIEGNDDLSDSSDTSSKSLGNTPPIDFEMKELKISEPALENVPEPQTVVSESSRKNSVDYEYNSAKANIEKAIRLSMALESYNSEGKEVCSRRRSAVDLPVRESLPSHGNSSISSTNVLSLPSLNPVSNDGSGGAAGSRTLSQSATPQAVPAKASTCTDKVESMVVVSQQVHGRARRSRSVPTSPRTVDTMPLLGKTLTKPLINEAEVSTDGEVECGSECEDSLPSGVSASLALSVQGGDALAEILSPSSCSTVTPNMGQPLSKQQTSSNQNLSIACETQAASQPLSSKDACALADYEIVECESSPASVAHSPATKLSSTAKAPAPPVRLSSLPPSPTLRGTSSTSRLSEQPSLSCDGEVRQGVQAVQRLRGASVPLQQQDNRASDSEGETCDGEVRAGSLPPALLPPADSTGLAQGSGPVGAIGPRSCVPGERDEDESNSTHHHQRHSHHHNHHGRSPVKESRKGEEEKTKERHREKRKEGEKKLEAERRVRRADHERAKIDEKRKSAREKTPGGEKKRTPQEEEKRRSLEDKERRERRRLAERENRRSAEKERRRSKEKSASPEKRNKEENRKKRERSQDKDNVSRAIPLGKRISTSSSTSSTSGGNSRMVQQKGSSNGDGEEGAPGRAELERRERIQRYKDERRKQMAARYGQVEWSSSEESGAGEETYSAYRRRRRRGGRDTNTSSNTDLSTHEAPRLQENGSPPEGRGRRVVGGSSSEDVVVSAGVGVRSTRTSRLRQAALASSSTTNNNNNNNNNNYNSASSNNNNNNIYAEGVGERGRGEASPDLAPLKRLPDQAEGRMCVDSADSPLSGSDGRGGRRHTGSSDKDKSHKRKSNLNRSTTSEVLPPTSDPLPAAQHNDSNEDTPRRRRRRGPLSPVGGGGGLSVSGAEPLKTPEVVRHVVSRLTPPVTAPTQPSALSSSQQPSLQSSAPAHTFQPIQPAAIPDSTHSAPSTLDSRARHAQDCGSRRLSGSLGNETEEGVRKVPPKLAPLKKPDIPDVLRPKDATSLASPGVVNTPPSSRPSSVVFDKPPLGPEGQRPVTLRTSLRKPTDIGTCFMAARREKRDDSKPENVFRDQLQRPKKGDRLSQSDMNLKIESSFSGKQDDLLSPGSSDLEVACISASSLTTATSSPALGSEEVMSSRLEALTARAKETMERADRLGKDSTPPPPESSPPEDSADSMVHECEQYLTVNAGRKELSGGVRPREVVSSEARSDNIQSPTVKKGVISDTGQKNWVGGSEGRGKESKRLAMEKEVNKEMKREPSQAAEPLKMTAASAVPSGPPDLATLGSDNLSPPPEEVVHGLRHVGYADEDVGSPESVQMRSPDHRSSSSSSGSKRSSRRCSLDGDTPQAVSPDPQSILKRRSSREDVTVERPTTPEPHSILKRKTSSRTSSIDIVEGEPRPILKKKSSVEELDHFEPRPILKKKSSTDDELDDRPRSILKGGRSREDLDLTEGFVSPNPILKRSPRCDSEGEGELRPILKRRDTTDGVRLRLHVSDGEDVEGEVPSVRVRSDSAPEAVIRLRGHSPPALSATPSHGILKKRGAHSPGRFDQMDSELGAILRSRRTQGVSDADSDSEATNRPQSPSLLALTKREESSSRSGERPLSVAERVAGMEAARQEPPPPAACRSPTPTRSPGARPKQTPSFLDRPPTPTEKGRDNRRNSAFALVAEPSPGDGTEAINEAFLDRPVTEAYNSAIFPNDDAAPTTPSVVSQKAAFFAQLEREQKTSPDTSPSRPGHTSRFSSRRDRGTRHATQPVTEEEVNQASRLAEASDSASHDSDSAAPRRESSSGFRAAREAVLRNSAEVMQGLTPGSSPRRRSSSRKTSVNEPEEDLSLDPVRGILKRDGSGGSREVPRDSPRSILKHFSDARRSSFSESEHPRGILKSESPLPPPIGSPEHEAKLLRGVLKKDSSLEDSKEIKSILKPESQSLERDHSSDSSSDDVTLTTGNAAQGPECDIADSIRDIDPVRHKDDQYKGDVPHKADPYKTEHHRADLAEALRHVEPIKSRDDLAEALRQIEPIHSKERSREREDRGREESLSVSVREFSSTSKVTTTMGTMVATASVPPQAPAVTNSSSSTSENELKIIKNEAIMRRKTNHARKYDERRSMVELRSIERATDVSSLAHQDASESSSSSSSESSEGQVKTSTTTATTTTTTRSYIGSDMDASQILRQSPIFRNKTSSPSPEQGIGEKASLRNASPASQTINARLAALQKSGEDGWKNRVKKDDKDFNSNVTLRPKPLGGHRERPVSLMDRMSALATSSQQWKGRVTQSDATKFTVAHKMASASTSSVPSLVSGMSTGVTRSPEQLLTPTGSPHLERKKRSPCQKIFKSKTGGNIPSLANKSSPSSPRKNFRRSISTPQDSERKAEAPEGTSVSVPQVDDDSFNAFFSKVPDSVSLNSEDAPELNEADFDHISVTASQLVVKRRSVRVARRQVASRNPLKALAAREDIKSEYVEVKMGTGEKELRRMKVEELSKSSSLAVEALAGLASRENFSAVALKKVENSPVVREMPPYTSLMLLHVKGRRHAQTRLVEPIATNINQGDDFVLITPSEIYHYKGEFANVIERAKAAEIAQYILQKKDMGVASATTIVEVTEHSPSSRKAKFWKHLGGDEKSEAKPAGLPEEDEYVEAALVAANKVYEVQEDSLVPLPDSWGQMPKIEILSSDKVLVLDFGSELYIWAGKRGCGDNRRIGVALGRELWEEEYDYTECDINPITPMMPMSKAKLKGTRPDWGLCAKLTENVETILFKEKFIDWPDLAQQSRIKEVKKELDRYVAPVCELQPCDAKMMLEELPLEPDLILEMSHLGRGVEYYDEEERRLLSISTNDFKVWHVSEYGKVLMSETSRCHLFTGDSYVVRWYYHVTATGRTLKGEPSKHNVTGRSRVAYFFWQGRDSSVSDKGVSALMTVELDEERGPHIRVSMGSEPPAFLNLFKGGLIVHQGHQDEEHENKDWRMFMVRGELENEGHLVEIDVNSQHLRSRGCLVLANLNTGVIHLWLGAKALKGTRDVGNTTAQKLMETPDSSIGWKSSATKKIKKQYEGAESRDFWEAFGGSKNNHFSLLDDEHSYDWTPRIWHLEAKHDSFQATEITCSYRATSTPNPLPVLQSELYSAKQPALFMVDSGHRVWVWQGWWPDESSDGDEFSATGSAVLRFNFARRAALQTALNYCQLKAKSQAKSLAAKSYKKTEVEVAAIEPQLVVAGMEPSEFTNVFPIWTPRPDVIAIQEKEGRWMPGGQYLVDDILAQLSRTRYSLAELTIKPLPDGVDPLHLEVYLSPEEFTEALGMNQDEFYSLQNWKQTEIKKKAKLF